MAATATVTLLAVDGGQFTVQSSYELRALHRQVPGGRWDPAGRVWRYPATPAVALALAEVFAGPHTRMAPAFRERLEVARAVRAASARAKVAEELPQPSILRADKPLWRHQLQGYHALKDLHGALLAADMGVGKTLTAIALWQNRGHRRTLVVCPRSVISVWAGQLAEYAAIPYQAVFLDGCRVQAKQQQAARCVEHAEQLGQPAVIVVNYESARMAPFADWALAQPWDFVIADELHKCKAAAGLTSRFMSRLGDRVPWRLGLSGTIAPHSPLDLYGSFRFLDKTVYGLSYTAFKARYAIFGGFGGHEVVSYCNLEELHRKLYTIAFRVEAKEVLDLPEHHHIYRTCTLSASAQKIYRDLERHMVAEIDQGLITAQNALVKLLRLQQCTSGYLQPDESAQPVPIDDAKAQLLREVLEELPDGEPVVVFTRFRWDLDTVRRVAEAQGQTVSELSGRRDQLQEWQEGTTGVLAVQIQSGSLGISLVRARYCVFFSLGFSLGDYTQALARLHRPGQTRVVTYLHLLAEQTIDGTVYDALHARREVVTAVLEGLGQEK